MSSPSEAWWIPGFSEGVKTVSRFSSAIPKPEVVRPSPKPRTLTPNPTSKNPKNYPEDCRSSGLRPSWCNTGGNVNKISNVGNGGTLIHGPFEYWAPQNAGKPQQESFIGTLIEGHFRSGKSRNNVGQGPWQKQQLAASPHVYGFCGHSALLLLARAS